MQGSFVKYIGKVRILCFLHCGAAQKGERMSYTNKTFEELCVIDDFLMSAVASDEEVGEPFCRTVLSVLLQRKIGRIKVTSQRFISALTPVLRGVRLDVEVEEYENEIITGRIPANIYDLEMSKRMDVDLPKHNRFYQAKIDAKSMRSGEKRFEKLPRLYVITITDFDPFGYDYMMYTVENKCKEIPELSYEDGLQFIYFYTKGGKGGNEEIKAMLRYLQDSTKENATNEQIREIHNYVERIRQQPEVKAEYMTLEDRIYFEVLDDMKEVVLELLEKKGEVSEKIRDKLARQSLKSVVKAWIKLAGEVTEISQFADKMNEVEKEIKMEMREQD